MEDPVTPYIAAPQSYQPIPPSSTLQQAQVISNTYPQQRSAQWRPPITSVSQSQASPSIHQQQQPGPTWYGPPPYSARQSYHTSFNSYQTPRSTQYRPSPPLPTSSNNYAYHQQDPQSAYPPNPPTQGRNTYPPNYIMAPVGFAPTSSPQIPIFTWPRQPRIAYSSTVASIKAVLQTTGSVLSYLRDVKEYYGHCETLISELTSIRGILDTLLDTLQSMEGLGKWPEKIQALGEQLGPLVLLSTILKNLLDQLFRSASAPSYVKFTKSLPWPFAFEEMKIVLKSIETEKSLLLMAVRNDIGFRVEITIRKADAVLLFLRGGRDGAPQPPVVGPQTSTLLSEPDVDNVTSLFSRTSINTNPATTTLTTVVRRLEPAPQDGVENVIRNVLIKNLATAQTNEMICPNHPCFDRSREFARKWSIPPTAIDNHVKLACGNRRYPVLMLLNPSPDHDSLSFDAMVQRCSTLGWIERVLLEMGLTLAEVIIIDICPLLSDRRIEKMNYYERSDAINERSF